MINELFMMTQSLKEKGLLQVTTHRDVRKPAGNAGVYIEIAQDGKPQNIEYMPKDKFTGLWKHSKGNHNSFPIIRIQNAMLIHNLPINFDEIWKKAKHKKDKIEILGQLDFYNYNPISDDIIISQWSIDQLLPVCRNNLKLGALEALINRFPKNQEEQREFYIALLSFVKNRILSFDEPLIELMKDVLIGKWDERKGRFISKTQIAFDVYDGYAFQYKVKDAKLESVLISELNKRDYLESIDEDAEVCQLTGQLQVIQKDKYPNPKLPNLGESYLYSNNKDIPCLSRYNLESLQAFKVSKKVINEINSALGFLTQEEREYKTWVRVPGSKDKESNLLLAYIVNEPTTEDELARLLGDAPSYEQEVLKFEILCEQVCNSLKEKTDKDPNVQVKVIILNKVDDGRKQVILSENYGAEQIISGATLWQKAFDNCPNIEYIHWANKEKITIIPFCPYPGQIINFMKKQWRWEVRNGKRNLRVEKKPGISMREVYDVFIATANEKEKCNRLLQKVCQQSQDLLISIGHYYNRKELFVINKNAVYDHCLAVSLLSILLYKLNHYKEDYMHSVSFNLGRLLMLADVLHREYCLNVSLRKGKDKKGKVPPQLIGNALMPTAAEFPNRALDLLRERIRIYKAWADSVSVNEDTKIAKWAVSQMGIVAQEMSQQDIPDSFNEVERAQVLLGYLARIEKEKEDKQ